MAMLTYISLVRSVIIIIWTLCLKLELPLKMNYFMSAVKCNYIKMFYHVIMASMYDK